MDWDKLKIFHTVAEASSFTKASTILNLSQSAISRQIQALESDLKVQLFERHARGLVLTENGDYLFKSAHEIISKLKDVETNLSGHKDKLNGKLIVTTVVSFGTTWLTPRIKEFMDLHPEIEIELIFDDKELDLSTRVLVLKMYSLRLSHSCYPRPCLLYFLYDLFSDLFNRFLCLLGLLGGLSLGTKCVNFCLAIYIFSFSIPFPQYYYQLMKSQQQLHQ